MSALTELQELIHSMTMNEKRYFQILSKRENSGAKSDSDPIFVRLFNKIADNLQTEEVLLKEELSKTDYYEQLPYQQTYLREQILRSLQHYRASSHSSIHVYNLLAEIQILSDNKLMKQAVKSLNKLKKAVEEGHISIVPEVYSWTEIFLRRGWIKDPKGAKLRELEFNKRKAITELSTDYEVSRINGEFVTLIKEGADNRDIKIIKEIKKLQKQLHEISLKETTSSFLLYKLYHSQSTAAFLLADYAVILPLMKKQISLLEKESGKDQFNLSRIEPHMNMQEIELMLLDFDATEKSRQRIKNLLDKRKTKLAILEKQYIELATSNRNLREHILKGSFKKGKSEYNYLLERLKKSEPRLTVMEYADYYFPILVFDYYTGNIESGLEKCRIYKNKGSSKQFQRHKKNAQMLELMFLEKMGQKKAHLKLTRYLNRIIKGNDFPMQCEENFLKLQLKLNRFDDAKQRRKAFQEAKDEARKMSNSNLIERSHHIALNLWLYYEKGVEEYSKQSY